MEMLRESGTDVPYIGPGNGFRFVRQVTRGKSEKEDGERISFLTYRRTPFLVLFPLAPRHPGVMKFFRTEMEVRND